MAAQENKIRKINPDEANTIAKDAFLFGMPLVFVEKQFDFNAAVTKPTGLRAPMNQFGHGREYPDASNRLVVGFNVDTLYSFASVDLLPEPIILSVPDMGDRYWVMQVIDAWNGVPAAPGSRTHGGGASDFAITSPRWKGELPAGIEELKSPTNMSLVASRIYCSGKEEYAVVNRLQDQCTLTPLSQWGRDYAPPEHVPVREGVDATTLVNQQFMALSAEQFYQNLNRLLVDNPAYPADAPVLKTLENLNIAPGADFSLGDFSPEVVEAISEGYAAGHAEMMASVKNLGEIKNGWQLAYDMGRYGTRYAYRAAWTFVGIGGNILEDAIYPTTMIDADGSPLEGANKYTITYAKVELPPAKAFWSLTMYDSESYLVPNDLNRYALGDRSELNFAPDGSLTIYLQKDSPGKDKEANWLPTPDGPFRLALRLYEPDEDVIHRRWLPSAVKKIQ
jgi:hypothetical protein